MLGIGLGVDWTNKKDLGIVASLIAAFQARVALDGGVFEAQSCLITFLNNLNKI